MDQIRKTYGIPYEEIKKGCGDVSISSIQKIFGGYVDRPRKATLEKLSKYFEKFIKDNMSGKDDFKHLYERTVRDEYVAESNRYFSRGSSALDNPSGSYGEIFTQGGYTYEDYAKLQLPEGVRVEVIDGYIYTMDAPNVSHQSITGEIFFKFREFIKNNKGECKVLMSPVDVRLEFDKDDMTVVQPDVLVICDREKKENKKNITGAPDFVLEVMSHSSRRMDMYVKMYDEMMCPQGHNPTIGILLCADTDDDVAHYSVLNGNDQLYAAKYLTYMPTQEELRREIEQQKEFFRLQNAKI
jgi:hypothetical protein